MEEVIKILKDTFYLKDDELHRDDGPAIVFGNGIEFWFKEGKLHRDNGPAIVDKNEIMQFWLDGKVATNDEITNILRNKLIDEL